MSAGRERPVRARWRSLAFDHDCTLSTAARAAAAAYAEYSTNANGELQYPPSAMTLAERMGCSERTARRARKELAEAGFLDLDERQGVTSRARLTFPTPAKSAGVTPVKSAGVEGGTPVTTPVTTPVKSAAGTRGTRGTSKSTSGGARARAHDEGTTTRAQELVAEYVERLRELGATAPRRLVGQVAKQVGELLGEGVAAPTVAAALELMTERRLHPSVLPSLVPEVELGPRGQPSGDQQVDVWKEAGVYDRA